MIKKVPIVGDKGYVTVQSLPQLKCPFCGELTDTIPLIAFDNPKDGKRLFIGFFCCCGGCSMISCTQTDTEVNILANWRIEPLPPVKPKHFSTTINSISPQFEDIYNQAYIAQKQNLLLICGAGFRKALECLIKDYCIYLHSESKESIIKSDFGTCIGDYIDSQTVKEIAERAAWLGNDESHYAKRWTDKDTHDLDELIRFLCRAIEQDEDKKRLIAEMPEQKKK